MQSDGWTAGRQWQRNGKSKISEKKKKQTLLLLNMLQTTCVDDVEHHVNVVDSNMIAIRNSTFLGACKLVGSEATEITD